jgi:hypothetical protein
MPSDGSLLPPLALRGMRVGLSVSDSADLKRLGLTSIHFQLALREVARMVLIGGGKLAYGGHLIPGGYTELLMLELGQYAQDGDFDDASAADAVPLLVCLASQEHRHCTLDELDRAELELGLRGELRCIDRQGEAVRDRTAGRPASAMPYPTDAAVLAEGLTALRRHMTAHTSARVLLGGRRHGYTGALPGVLEEAVMALHAGQPLYLAAGFGGVTLDIAAAVDRRCAGLCPTHASDPASDGRTVEALDALQAMLGTCGWNGLANGLDDDENLRLATTHRPSEIAALVCLGLGRKALALRSSATQRTHPLG